MDDNLSLSEKTKARYRTMYSGVFFDRFILGLWVLAEGIIYPMYKEAIEQPPEGKVERYCISIDYGTQNAFSVSLWGKYGKVWYIVDEYAIGSPTVEMFVASYKKSHPSSEISYDCTSVDG